MTRLSVLRPKLSLPKSALDGVSTNTIMWLSLVSSAALTIKYFPGNEPDLFLSRTWHTRRMRSLSPNVQPPQGPEEHGLLKEKATSMSIEQ
eukprot:CAMPEP_0117648080 /NCGR_PEP_ID=MMETSP0804-20121206/198_1 /TAXON_ID=1074897 /ORGANISM="Tetraselmis astigmatica, Strain CCMP880" /LENGTH=90 /DNA_ID=CAMNT_0005453627 /DNA_START=89 /DNA_END=361 /DNA_ORIENTATION=+